MTPVSNTLYTDINTNATPALPAIEDSPESVNPVTAVPEPAVNSPKYKQFLIPATPYATPDARAKFIPTITKANIRNPEVHKHRVKESVGPSFIGLSRAPWFEGKKGHRVARKIE